MDYLVHAIIRQATVKEYVEKWPRTCIHLFGDDPRLLEHLASSPDYAQQRAAGQIQIGSIMVKALAMPGTSGGHYMSTKALKGFPRPTTAQEFCIEVLQMGLCDCFIGTKGSTVSDLVVGLKNASPAGFAWHTTIGEWPADKPVTQQFHWGWYQLLFNKKLWKHLLYVPGLKWKHEATNIVHNLTEEQVKEMYKRLENFCCVEKEVSAAYVCSNLWGNLPYTKSNRDEFNKKRGTDGPRWLMTVINLRLNPWALENKGHTLECNNVGKCMKLHFSKPDYKEKERVYLEARSDERSPLPRRKRDLPTQSSSTSEWDQWANWAPWRQAKRCRV